MPKPKPKPELRDDASSPTPTPPRKKQKRNKPTLSCGECVERKTKCDRGRPGCLACMKRQSSCKYSDVANLIATTDGPARHVGRAKRATSNKPVPALAIDTQALPIQAHTHTHPPAPHTVPPTPAPRAQYRSVSLSSTGSSPFLLSNIPFSNHTASPFFGLGSDHPFANYWTSRGGLAEVIGVLPAKDQADILVAKYFDAVDPVYPMVHRRNFYADYDRFWSLPHAEKQAADPVLLALHFVVYAMATQFIGPPTDHKRSEIAEFYVSASQQALRLSSYLSRTSVRTLQAMVLICYFLMNDNHASDAWAFGGVLIRQSYAMGLHRDPDIIAPRCSLSDKQQRRKLWQAVFFQDTFLTVLLKLPPTATFSDVRVESLTDELGDYLATSNGSASNGTSVNPMSISNIAQVTDIFPTYELQDRQYIRSMWHMANLVQRTVCNPRSLGSPIIRSAQGKTDLVNEYHQLLNSFPPLLTTSEDSAIQDLASNLRLLRQNLFLRSNYWHCVMVIQADEYEAGGVSCDIRGALEAARNALLAFFHFWEYLRIDAGVWWVFQHRAFEEALLMARMLGAQEKALSVEDTGMSPASDPLLTAAREDSKHCLVILDMVSAPEVQKTRTDVLRTALADINW
ncbi:zn 2cys6 transcription factor [Paraphaeosphaeria minitans]|uniref:Zn 2cys6 transcription factor n=1 Tax=Paraphaeosphaeria minitans TaxID=565426 RepID=A0A9P6KK35_9PLEO|nr:zn 2cys6 transcription factor [Paraphaeosphaeria minitans]